MGNSASIAGWSKRTPDGPLFPNRLNYPVYGDPSRVYGISSGAFLPFFGEELFLEKNAANSPSKPLGTGCVAGTVIKPNESPTPTRQQAHTASVEARYNRRRPTYSAKMMSKKAENETASSDSESDSASKSAKDLRSGKLLEFKKLLTTEIKLKSAIFYEKVRITISNDGTKLLWYKPKDVQASAETAGKPLGVIVMNKITSTKCRVDEARCLEVNLGNTSYSIMFKSQQDRSVWQKNFNLLRKFMSMV